jgi:formylglycine-generating enzyme required for sulfatase activity
VTIFLRTGRTALAACALALSAAEPALSPHFETLQQIGESGRIEHAMRIVEMRLIDYPDDPRLQAYRAHLAQQIALSKDDPAHLPARTGAPRAIANHRAEFGQDFTGLSADIPMIWIQPGSFLMANPLGSDDDTLVTLSRGYWIGRTEVTQEQWRAIMENLPSPSYFKGSDRPVENIAWSSAMEFGRKLTERERAAGRLPAGYEYTLPTEAQWEYACRAGTTGPYAGNLADLAWFKVNSVNQTHPVAQKQPNAWNLYDMHGNVWEWCLDGYGGYPGGTAVDPMNGYEGPSAAMLRIMRGGAYSNVAGQCRSGARHRGLLAFTGSGCGFRIALAPQRTLPAMELVKPGGAR